MDLVLLILCGIIVVTCTGLGVFLFVKTRKKKKEKVKKQGKDKIVIETCKQTKESFWQKNKKTLIIIGGVIYIFILVSFLLVMGMQGRLQLPSYSGHTLSALTLIVVGGIFLSALFADSF